MVSALHVFEVFVLPALHVTCESLYMSSCQGDVLHTEQGKGFNYTLSCKGQQVFSGDMR